MNNEGGFFVMVNTQNGGYTALTTINAEDLYEIAKFKTEEAARAGAESSVLGHNFGYEVFEVGMGL